MRRLTSGVLTMLVLLSLLTSIQASPLPGESTRSAEVYGKGVSISGKVNGDGQTFLADDDNKWVVSNPGALKGQEGRYVTLKCRMDLNRRAIHVLSVQQDQPGTKHAGGDSAFRR